MAWSRSDDKRLEQALLALGRGERRENGEPVGLAELYELMGRAIFTTAYVITGHREDAEDILQDTLVEIYQDARFYRPRTNPRAWVLAVTRHTALDAVRKRTRHATAPLDTAEALPTPPDAHDEFTALWDLLAVLSPEERELVVLRLYHGLSHGEIAETLRISTAAAQKRYRRAIDKLRAHHGVPNPTSTATKGDRHEDE
ncbi:MAG: RNA polymerase sigma factor [Clostridia bacterium]|nr:RNA polymerase sigma factor [Clostridia bacterium]